MAKAVGHEKSISTWPIMFQTVMESWIIQFPTKQKHGLKSGVDVDCTPIFRQNPHNSKAFGLNEESKEDWQVCMKTNVIYTARKIGTVDEENLDKDFSVAVNLKYTMRRQI
ncbi:hypothetical protein SADUNF_Sadunf05G0012800 [Salix dunnii]|uniref:Uncharacterized protein n=1 Tax=Salix dunnii TaxID=1413687 RepID=A0A835N1I4_9ROSI|nr:hypothetical protein SADUNF_Sadunf05G0012800 [Salix dunnii]